MDFDRTPTIQVEGVHKAYRRGASATPVLSGVDLEVEAGECVFLAGPSGSGKTTLLSIVGCILTADRGSVRVLGEDLAALDDRGRTAMRRERIGFVFQRAHLIRGLTARDNVCVPLALGGVSPEAARERAEELLEAVGLEAVADCDPRSLSAGQCQRVAVARALVADPELVLADEPTAALDSVSGTEVMELMSGLCKEKGKTVVVVTHDVRTFGFADRILHLEDGRVRKIA